jgi:LysR family transcriptional regulator, cyn operon transcriptional activator
LIERKGADKTDPPPRSKKSLTATHNRYLRRNGVHPHVALEANSIAAIVEIVRLAGLATILPQTVAQLQRRGGYRSAASRAFVAVAQGYAKAIQD